MKKILSLFAVVALSFGAVTPAFAAMPNYIGTDYKQAPNCVVGQDHGIWELDGSNYVLTGCITPEAWGRAEALAQRTQTGIKIGVGQSVTLKTGRVEVCPFWFIPSAGCVIAADLVR